MLPHTLHFPPKPRWFPYLDINAQKIVMFVKMEHRRDRGQQAPKYILTVYQWGLQNSVRVYGIYFQYTCFWLYDYRDCIIFHMLFHLLHFQPFPPLSELLFSLSESLFCPSDLQATAALLHPEPLCPYYCTCMLLDMQITKFKQMRMTALNADHVLCQSPYNF